MKKATLYASWRLSHPVSGALRERLVATLQVSSVEGYVGDAGWTTELRVDDVDVDFETKVGDEYEYPRELFSVQEIEDAGYRIEDVRPVHSLIEKPRIALTNGSRRIIPRDRVQQEAFDAFKGGCSGHLILTPGKGKTALGLKIAAEEGHPIIVFVHDGALMQQWRERVQSFLPGATIGEVRGPFRKWDWKGKDVVIATFQSFYTQYGKHSRSSEFKEFINYFNWALFDEAHHLKARTFSLACRVFPCKRLGLTATPIQNGFEALAYSHVGPVRYEDLTLDLVPTVYTHQVKLDTSHPVYSIAGGATQHTQMESALLGGAGKPISREYFLPIVELVKEKLEEGRKILLMSSRVDPGHYLESEFFPGISVLTGQVPFEERTALLNATNPVYVTTGIGEEGLDRPELDTLILLTPYAAGALSVNKFSQAAGRVCRLHDEKLDPEVHVFYPSGPVGKKYLASTVRASNKLGFNLSASMQDHSVASRMRAAAAQRVRAAHTKTKETKKMTAEEALRERMRLAAGRR